MAQAYLAATVDNIIYGYVTDPPKIVRKDWEVIGSAEKDAKFKMATIRVVNHQHGD